MPSTCCKCNGLLICTEPGSQHVVTDKQHRTMGGNMSLFTACRYEEVQDYDFSKPGFSMETGHFTQVVWKWSTQLGCGVRNCPTVGSVSGFDNGGIMVVCRYKPPGNCKSEQPVLAPPLWGLSQFEREFTIVSSLFSPTDIMCSTSPMWLHHQQ